MAWAKGIQGGANWGTHEVEADSANPDNVSLDGHGNLRITPLRDAGGSGLRHESIRCARTNCLRRRGGASTHEGMFLILNVTIGGEFSDRLSVPVPTPIKATEPGHAMLVDYVAVWTKVN